MYTELLFLLLYLGAEKIFVSSISIGFVGLHSICQRWKQRWTEKKSSQGKRPFNLQ